MLYNYRVFLSEVEGCHPEYLTMAEIEDPTVYKLLSELKQLWEFEHDEPFEEVWTPKESSVERVVCANSNGDVLFIVVSPEWMHKNQAGINRRQRRLADHLGRDLCDIQMIEEASELQKALCKFYRATHGGFKSAEMDKLRADIVEELGDVLACAENIKHLYNINDIELQQGRDKKLKRAFERYGIDKEE